MPPASSGNNSLPPWGRCPPDVRRAVGAIPLLLLLLSGCAKTTDPVRLGRAAFITSGCNVCHAVGPGGPTTGPNLAFIGYTHTPEFLDLWLKSPSAWRKDTAMPDPQLPEPVRRNLVAYLSTLKGQAHAGAGGAVYRGAGCANCHGPAGKGGFPDNNVPGGKVPGLLSLKEGYSKKELLRRLKVGVPHPQKQDPDGPEPMLSMPAWGKVLKAEELDALADYLLSLSPAEAAKADW